MMTGTLDRRAAVARLLADRRDLVIVTGLGSPTYDVAACGEHDRNFHLWGAMGGAVAMGLGIALAQPETPVAVVTGDGEALMGMGALATVALQKPANLTIVIIDNGLYEETGGQASHTGAGSDLAAVARGCGIADAIVVTREEELPALAARLHAPSGAPALAVLKVAPGEAPRVLPGWDGPAQRLRTTAALLASRATGS
ncbi:thiamine pyrophosphate-dependent enzyme [Plastoroseomonas hellenica]|uniref:thiamine pyrophosphate-dependent enzyme n=1 Tax=Plastoroseomonas hellenica TaxID=2687306 RepID=UPI0020133854|nr:thiamine pyrophosphate-dependent enzyme [Plastoroseomonas hellenica]